MKFAIIALLGLVSIDAIKLHQRSTVTQGPPTAAELVALCDTDASGDLTLDEAHACINENVQDAEEAQRLSEEVDASFATVDADGNGAVSEAELEAALRARGPGGPP
jgi:Ca2+-binding EF-hand superfamily protein